MQSLAVAPCCMFCHHCEALQLCHLCDWPSSCSRYNLTSVDWGRITFLSLLAILLLTYPACMSLPFSGGALSGLNQFGIHLVLLSRFATWAVSSQYFWCANLF